MARLGNQQDWQTVTWKIDNTLIATVDASTVVFGGDNIFLGHFDTNTGSSTDPNARSLLFGLVDNVIVTVPEPSTCSALIAGIGLMHLRRRRNSHGRSKA